MSRPSNKPNSQAEWSATLSIPAEYLSKTSTSHITSGNPIHNAYKAAGHRRTQSQFEMHVKPLGEPETIADPPFSKMIEIHKPLEPSRTQEAIQASTKVIHGEKQIIIDMLDEIPTASGAPIGHPRKGFVGNFRGKTITKPQNPVAQIPVTHSCVTRMIYVGKYSSN